MTQFNWSPGIGDPTIGGWITVILYLLAAISCWRTSVAVATGAPMSSEFRTWLAIAIIFLALGLNKQLDLQTALTEIGRMLALREGWYGLRQSVQVNFILFVAASCMAIALVLVLLARHSPIPTWFALTGMMLVLGFVLIRAASFHHIDHFIGQEIIGLRWNWVLEMSGISVALLASEWRRKWRSIAPA